MRSTYSMPKASLFYHLFIGIMKSSNPLKFTYTIVYGKVDNTQRSVMTTVKEYPRKGDSMKGHDI